MIKKLLRITALIVSLLAVLQLCACSGGNEGDEPTVTEPAETEQVTAAPRDEAGDANLTEAQEARIKKLAAAFFRFGPCNMKEGVPVSQLERIIYCMCCDDIAPCELDGYGRISIEEADALVSSVFKDVSIPDLFRTKYDAAAEQELFLLNDHYYIRITDDPVVSTEMISCRDLAESDGRVTGIVAEVRVLTQNGGGAVVKLELDPIEEYEYTLISCESEYIS